MKSIFLSLLLLTPSFAHEGHDKDAETTTMAAEISERLIPAALKEAGFKSIFNGKDLDNFRKTGGNASYEIKDGAIRGFGKDINDNTFLITKETYKDFIFAFQVKFLDPKGNSGCMFRAQQKDGKPDGRVFGYQCEHDQQREVPREWTAGLFDEKRRGWLSPHKTASKEVKAAFTEQGKRLFKWDGWNTIVIKCEGNHIKTYLNGELRADFTDTDEKKTDLEGFFGLQVHKGKSGDILWKNLFIKEL